MNKSRAAVADIDTITLIPLAMMVATTNTGRPAQQNCKDHENIAADMIANESQGARC
jgi:hypothetical protein